MQANQLSDNQQVFIFASCKEWHRALFDQIIRDGGATWIYVASPEEMEKVLTGIRPRYIFFLHWNWMVPAETWMTHECVCFHMTDVPYGRGGSPLQNLILAGHEQTMLTALRMVKEVDAGPVYAKRPLSLEGSAEEIYIRAGRLSGEIMQWMIERDPLPVPQQGEPVLFKRRKPEQSVLRNHGSLKEVHDFIRMLDADGYPKAFIDHGDYVIHFGKSSMEGDCVVAEVEIKLQNKLLPRST